MRKEVLSSFMDDELVNPEIDLSSLIEDKEIRAKWHRYHIARQAMQHTLPPYLIPSHVSENIIEAIDTVNQPVPEEIACQKKSLLYPRMMLFSGRIAQIGVAACVTLSIIVGVQYYANKESSGGEMPAAFNTMPIGINASPVGGLNPVMNTPERKISEHKISQKQYEKIYLLLQDHELQKRLDATR